MGSNEIMDVGGRSINVGRRTLLTATAAACSGCISSLTGDKESARPERPESTSWAMAGGNAENTSKLGPNIGSKFRDLSWSKSLGTEFASPIITTSEYAFVNTQSKLLGFDKSNGETTLSKPLPGAKAAAPALTDDYIFVPRDTLGEGFDSSVDLEAPQLHALRRTTKDIAWTLTLDGAYLSSVAVAEDIYIQSDREVYRVKPDGTVVWRRGFDDSFDLRKTISYIRPTIGHNSVYIGHRDSIIKLNRASGEVVWTQPVGKVLFSPVITSESTVIASTSTGAVGLDPSDSRTRWQVDGQPLWAPATKNNLSIISKDKKLVGIDQSTGNQQWSTQMTRSTCPPVIAGDAVYLAPGGTDLVAVNLNTGGEIGKLNTDNVVRWITPDISGLFTRMPDTDGPLLRRYQLK